MQPVLDAVAERAALLCEAPLARVLLVDGDVFRAMAWYSLDGTSQARMDPLPLKRTTIVGRAVLERATIHHDDVVPLLETEYPDALNARRHGVRAVLAVPLIREGNAYGAILLWRREPGLFRRDQVALVQTFAQQAAIAIDNVRLFHETKEALEQQTATSEILRVISRSQTDVQPVFETIAANALRLCDARLSATSSDSTANSSISRRFATRIPKAPRPFITPSLRLRAVAAPRAGPFLPGASFTLQTSSRTPSTSTATSPRQSSTEACFPCRCCATGRPSERSPRIGTWRSHFRIRRSSC